MVRVRGVARGREEPLALRGASDPRGPRSVTSDMVAVISDGAAEMSLGALNSGGAKPTPRTTPSLRRRRLRFSDDNTPGGPDALRCRAPVA